MKTFTAYIAFTLLAALSTALPQQRHNHHPNIPSSKPLNLTKGDISKGAITGGIIEGSPDGSNMLVAPGRAIVKNNCPFDLYMQSVNPTSDEPGKKHPSQPAFVLPTGSIYQEHMRYCEPDCGGVSIKAWFTSGTGLLPTQFEYTVNAAAGEIWYDISYVDCAVHSDGHTGSSKNDPPKDGSRCPGHAQGSSVSSNAPNSRKHVCQPGDWCVSEIYWVDSYPVKIPQYQEPTAKAASAGAGNDVVFNACSTELAF